MQKRIAFAVLAAVLSFTPSRIHGAEPDCRTSRLSGGYARIAIAGQALILLNGSEDPRLRRVMEMWLSTAVDDTEAVLNEGGDPKSLYPAPNLSESARRASVYARAHMTESLASRLERLAALIKP